MQLDQAEFDRGPVVRVPVDALTVAGSPRLAGEDPEHVETLAASEEELPPIIVHRGTMRVVDGFHRLRAARLRGQETIAVRFFDGGEADAFVLAVRSNVTHGLPLSLADRKRAAERIIVWHAEWSDRRVASVTGIAPRTVAEIRRRLAGGAGPEGIRIGQDGRVRPIDGSAGRRVAGDLLTENPALSLRQVARVAGISPETVRDVRNRLALGLDPVPQRRRDRAAQNRTADADGARAVPAIGLNRAAGRGRRGPAPDRAALVARLKADPALRFTETGRNLLRLLTVHALPAEEWEALSGNVPPHCSAIVADLARQFAGIWNDFAVRVEADIAKIS
ncbi:Transcriptional regulator NovG [Actinomadura rubteroloni]|uniref:Transcriptional regulator NovG n=1 Tax=Actinomadura rubteroloni TaxID=1926885 RepID=A0A2P4UIS6_9ACTN|nr:ParB N-terminal domain-containing protein [Actinomadura rubteroloni]POM24969.1 Transcriptional regulator NovG [Actinomadura rubteroloni]